MNKNIILENYDNLLLDILKVSNIDSILILKFIFIFRNQSFLAKVYYRLKKMNDNLNAYQSAIFQIIHIYSNLTFIIFYIC